MQFKTTLIATALSILLITLSGCEEASNSQDSYGASDYGDTTKADRARMLHGDGRDH